MDHRRGVVCLALAMAGLPAPAAHAARETAPALLPLSSVVLYESGVGYFERRGTVQRNASLSLLVPQNHLDDALITLVVLTTDGARVGAMTFPSVLAPEAALAESPAPFDAFSSQGSILPLLGAMAGLQARLVTSDGRTLEGRVIGVAQVEEPAPGDCGEAGSAWVPGDGPPPEADGRAARRRLPHRGRRAALVQARRDRVGPADEPARTALDAPSRR